MTGDLYAMYRFIQFIGHIIMRQKAIQNTWIGVKLLELTEASQKATQRLLNTEVGGEDLKASANWQKELQKTRSEEAAATTSQKLLAQMMEEYTQLAEQMLNLQKSTLDVAGKVYSNLTVFR